MLRALYRCVYVTTLVGRHVNLVCRSSTSSSKHHRVLFQQAWPFSSESTKEYVAISARCVCAVAFVQSIAPRPSASGPLQETQGDRCRKNPRVANYLSASNESTGLMTLLTPTVSKVTSECGSTSNLVH